MGNRLNLFENQQNKNELFPLFFFFREVYHSTIFKEFGNDIQHVEYDGKIWSVFSYKKYPCHLLSIQYGGENISFPPA